MNNRNKYALVLLALGLFFGSVIASTSTMAANDAIIFPLDEHISLGTYVNTAVSELVDKDDYMLNGYYYYTTMGETLWAYQGESSAGSGTSYIDLGASCLIGDYGSYPMSWADFSYIKSSYSSTVTATGDSAWVVGTNCTAPSLSAGATSSYISLQMGGDASSDAGSTAENIVWTADCWSDVDSDGTDDSATVPEEDFVHFPSTTYIYGAAMVDSSDNDVATYGYITLGFYVDSSTTYDVTIKLNGGSDAASNYVSSWTYTGATAATLDFYEAEGNVVVFLIDLADLISDDTDSSPVVSGIDWVKLGINAADDYSTTTATIDFYLYNLCVLDELPAITDNDYGQTSPDWNGAANNAAIGDGTYYMNHDILLPYIAAATNNAFTGYVYVEDDLLSGARLNNLWRHVCFKGTSMMKGRITNTDHVRSGPPYEWHYYVTYDFNQYRISDGKLITSTYQPSYSSQVFKIKTDDNVFYSPENSYDKDWLYANVKGINELDSFKSALKSQADATWVTMYTFGSVDSSGQMNMEWGYKASLQPSLVGGGEEEFNIPAMTPAAWGVVGAIGLAVIILAVIRRRRK